LIDFIDLIDINFAAIVSRYQFMKDNGFERCTAAFESRAAAIEPLNP
jgi:hypothetical protein